MLGVIVPEFTKVFTSSGKAVPAATQFLMNCSSLVVSYWWTSLVLLAGLFFLIRAIQADGKVRASWDLHILRMPLIGKIVHYSNLSRMLRTMSVLMKSGVHLLDTVTISSKVLSNSTMKASIASLTTDLRKGEKLSKALSKSEYITPMVTRMLAVGEETGQPGEMLGRIAERFEEEVKKRLKKIIALFEPLMILMLAMIVGSILIIMFMSILDLQSGL
jgi:type II secretory pathway component PulF